VFRNDENRLFVVAPEADVVDCGNGLGMETWLVPPCFYRQRRGTYTEGGELAQGSQRDHV